jgi:hypothetical protein
MSATLATPSNEGGNNVIKSIAHTSELYNFNFSNIGNDIYLSPFNSRIIVEPHRIPIEIRHIIPAPFQNYIETASKKGLLNNPVESPMFLTAMQDLRTIIEPLFNKTTTRIMRKDIPDGTLDLLAITGLLHCMPVIEKLVRVPVSPYLEHFNDAVVRLFHNPKEPGFSLQFQISYRDSRGKGEEMNRTFGLPEDISRLIR